MALTRVLPVPQDLFEVMVTATERGARKQSMSRASARVWLLAWTSKARSIGLLIAAFSHVQGQSLQTKLLPSGNFAGSGPSSRQLKIPPPQLLLPFRPK